MIWLQGSRESRNCGVGTPECGRSLGNTASRRVGGVADHVHLVTTLPRTLSQAEMLEGLKKKSSKWIKGLAPDYRRFYWQRGYGAFSVSPSQLDALLRYVDTQEEHHRSRTFQGRIPRVAAQTRRRV
jgi:hypothetical protein